MSEQPGVGRRLRRLAEREAKRADGRQRNSFSQRQGRGMVVYRAGRVKEPER
jgi:hypothetical protein